MMHRPEATHQDAVAAGHSGVWIYRRDGCPFCLRLSLTLAARRLTTRARWVDIWADDEARAYVASVNDGNETVPTVVVDGRPSTNPPPADVVRALRRPAA